MPFHLVHSIQHSGRNGAFYAPDQTRFLDYARSSAGEFRTQAIVGQKAGFLPTTTAEPWIHESRQLAAMIQGLIRSLGPRK